MSQKNNYIYFNFEEEISSSLLAGEDVCLNNETFSYSKGNIRTIIHCLGPESVRSEAIIIYSCPISHSPSVSKMFLFYKHYYVRAYFYVWLPVFAIEGKPNRLNFRTGKTRASFESVYVSITFRYRA